MIHIDTYADYIRARGMPVPTIRSRTLGRNVKVPCMATLLVSRALIVANAYNPNSVPPDKMALLRESIVDNGFCFPVVVIADDDGERFVVIDGFHRNIIGGPDWLDFDYVPVVVLEHDMTQRMYATVQFNKARGHHQVDLDAEVIRALVEQGETDEQIAERLQIEVDTVHRYKQMTGVAAMFANTPYSLSWSMVDEPEPDGDE